MLNLFKPQAKTAQEAVAVYEDSISYFMPATFEADAAAADAAAEDAVIPYYEAA